MLGKTLLICIILGAVSTEPIRKSIIIPNDIITSVLSGYAEKLELSLGPKTMQSMKNFVNSAIGLKLSALEIVVKIVNWITSNLIGIAIGGIIVIGICKITGKCNLGYDHAFSKLYSVVTTERLEMAQNLLISALRRFEEEDKEEERGDKEDEQRKAGD